MRRQTRLPYTLYLMGTVLHVHVQYLHYLQGSRIETIGQLHYFLLGLVKHVIPDVFLVCGQVVLQPLQVGPLVLPGGHRHGTRGQVSKEVNTNVQTYTCMYVHVPKMLCW